MRDDAEWPGESSTSRALHHGDVLADEERATIWQGHINGVQIVILLIDPGIIGALQSQQNNEQIELDRTEPTYHMVRDKDGGTRIGKVQYREEKPTRPTEHTQSQIQALLNNLINLDNDTAETRPPPRSYGAQQPLPQNEPKSKGVSSSFADANFPGKVPVNAATTSILSEAVATSEDRPEGKPDIRTSQPHLRKRIEYTTLRKGDPKFLKLHGLISIVLPGS
ncbi:hypothetical protein LTR05_001920 [Lithohypha guttulata]|uniref:Uncharacterized protein n=1 Tax=Lithohypha guttulata TaxID=1690604 RepID=A0AAN7T8F6_9EURO|nr:hypothetical protein LTR05_001920 [Lithohypha guttulata]